MGLQKIIRKHKEKEKEMKKIELEKKKDEEKLYMEVGAEMV